MKLPPLCPAVLLSSAYLPPVEYLAWAVRSGRVLIEQWDTYRKQTFRNRCLIATTGGVQALTVPVERPAAAGAPMRDLRISDHGHWRRLHWQALQSAYRSSPYFDYFADDFAPFFEQRHTFLVDFNEALLRLVLQCMDLEASIGRTAAFRPFGTAGAEADLREAIQPKHPSPTGFRPRPYYQVFAGKHGFLPNLSCVDLLFCMGRESVFVLRDSLTAESMEAPGR